MDHLRCQRPERVRNEFQMHLVGYNLIRHVMAVAAFESGISPWEVSFKRALQSINNLLPVLATPRSTDTWCRVLLEAVASHVVDNRPDRIEPRCIKRRPKPYKKLREPRANYKRRMAS